MSSIEQCIISQKKEYPTALLFLIFSNTLELPNDWEEFFEQHTSELSNISNFLQNQKGKIIYPSFNEVFRIYYDIPPKKVSVLILGQDPYHTDGSACGYAFSVKNGKKLNPSLINIKTELKNEGFNIQKDSGDLTSWVEQGVFLLNTALTVERGKPNSHKDVWENFTRSTIKYVTRVKKNLPIILWGRSTQRITIQVFPVKTPIMLFRRHIHLRSLLTMVTPHSLIQIVLTGQTNFY